MNEETNGRPRWMFLWLWAALVLAGGWAIWGKDTGSASTPSSVVSPKERVAAGPAQPHFYCLAAGNEVGRECLETKTKCEHGSGVVRKNRKCFSQERSYCLSVNEIRIGEDWERIPTGNRQSVCAATPQECEAFRKDYLQVKAQREPSACVEASHREVWP